MSSGGGGQTQTTSGGIDPEFKPYLREVLQDVTGRYREDVTGSDDVTTADRTVAAETAEQQEALGAAQTLGREFTQGYDPAAIERQLSNVQGQQLAQGQGTLGSARADRARSSALADQSLQLQQASDQRRGQGIQALSGVAADRQARAQARLDAPHTQASRYFGYLGNAPQQQTATTSGGGK